MLPRGSDVATGGREGVVIIGIKDVWIELQGAAGSTGLEQKAAEPTTEHDGMNKEKHVKKNTWKRCLIPAGREKKRVYPD